MRNTYPKPKPLCPLFAITRKVLPDGNCPIKCQEERCAWWIQGVEGAAVADSGCALKHLGIAARNAHKVKQ